MVVTAHLLCNAASTGGLVQVVGGLTPNATPGAKGKMGGSDDRREKRGGVRQGQDVGEEKGRGGEGRHRPQRRARITKREKKNLEWGSRDILPRMKDIVATGEHFGGKFAHDRLSL